MKYADSNYSRRGNRRPDGAGSVWDRTGRDYGWCHQRLCPTHGQEQARRIRPSTNLLVDVQRRNWDRAFAGVSSARRNQRAGLYPGLDWGRMAACVPFPRLEGFESRPLARHQRPSPNARASAFFHSRGPPRRCSRYSFDPRRRRLESGVAQGSGSPPCPRKSFRSTSCAGIW